MSDIRIKMAKDLRDMSDMVGDLHWMAAKAVEDLTKKDGEISKRDEKIARLESDNRSKNGSLKAFGEQIAGLQKAVRNRERLVGLRDARILELESQYQRDVFGLNNEGDPIGGDPAGGYANDNARLRSELAAIKAQEPVAWPEGGSDAVEGAALGAFDSLGQPEHDLESWCAGYAEAVYAHAAPVSEAKEQGVAMPAELDRAFITGESCDGVYRVVIKSETLKEMQAVHNWIARLNAAPIQQVSVPDGWRELAKRADDFLYSLQETDSVLRLRADLCTMLAAPAAPAADAGIVDMYRHLQKVTPYRFKKIQDASVTDGGDVLYFHKDRFDAALLDDMAANCAAKGVV